MREECEIVRESAGFELFDALIERAADPVVVVDATGTIRLVNAGAERAIGWSVSVVKGRSLADHCVLDKEELQPHALFARASRERSTRFSCEVRGTKGKRRWARFLAEPIGKAWGLLLVVEAVSSISSFDQEAGDAFDYEISIAMESFGELLQVSRLGLATFRAEGGARCFEVLRSRDDPCPDCPVMRSTGEPWPRSIARQQRNEQSIEITTAELVGPSKARIRVRRLGLGDLRAARELHVRELAARASLSPSEENVFQLLVQGDSPLAIAEAVGVTERTVKFHQANLLQKLGLESRFELLRLFS